MQLGRNVATRSTGSTQRIVRLERLNLNAGKERESTVTTKQEESGTDSMGYVPDLGGPYSGRMSKVVGYTPKFLRGFIIEAGGMARLLGNILSSASRRPIGYWGAVVDDMAMTIKRSWLPVSMGIFGFLMFASILTVQFVSMVGAEQLFGPVLFLQTTRSFTVWVDAIVVAGVIGAALTADLGARKVREELDAMEVMGVDPVRDIAVPRVISITLITTLLSVPSLIVTVLSMQLGAQYVVHMPAADFYQTLFANATATDLVAVVINSFLVGLLIGTVCCYKGFAAAGGATGLGRAVNQAVVIAFVSVWIMQLAYQALILGLFPNLGQFR